MRRINRPGMLSENSSWWLFIGCHRWLVFVLLFGASYSLLANVGFAADPLPQSLDDRIVIELFAEAPDIVTPIGIVVDRHGRALVVESHTHFRPDDYEGPAADRIRAFKDTTGDGRADRITTYFEGTQQTMSIALAEDDSLFVATRREVFRLRDEDGDGMADSRTPIAKLETEGNYPHNGLSGVTLDGLGSLYFSLGENLGATYDLVGHDGTTFSGGGEGGSIFRCRTDGTELERFATGFWNTFSLAFDVYGNLFAVDNDPDSRPPCRLLHVVSGGDYGYRFRNGRTGLHPFTSWNGELPGTLPMVSGVGDAPSGVIAYEFGSFPPDFQGNLLVTSAWIHHRIERHRLHREGTSFRSTSEVLIQGNDRFRPIDIAAAPDGSLLVTDWVDPSYNVHRQGRIWRIRARESASNDEGPATRDVRSRLTDSDIRVRRRAARQFALDNNDRGPMVEVLQEPQDPRARLEVARALATFGSDDDRGMVRKVMRHDDSEDVRAALVRLLPKKSGDWLHVARSDASPLVQAAAWRRATLGADNRPGLRTVLDQLNNSDAFVRQAARDALIRAPHVLAAIPTEDLSAGELKGVMIASRLANIDGFREKLGFLLKHADHDVRFIATQWIGEEGLQEFRRPLEQRLTAPETTGAMLRATLTSLALLDGKLPKDAERGGDKYLASLIQRSDIPASTRLEALRLLPANHTVLTAERLAALLASDSQSLQSEAVRVLRECDLRGRNELLSKVAFDVAKPPEVRAEAIVGLSTEHSSQVAWLLELAGNRESIIRREAMRSLVGAALSDEQQQTLQDRKVSPNDEASLVRRIADPSWRPARPSHDDIDGWQSQISESGDAAAGQRVFFHPRLAGCGRCHRVAGRGASIGPDLTFIARSMDRRKLLETILQPSREIAPHYQSWALETTEGKSLVAMLLRRGGTKSTYADRDGKTFELPHDKIDVQIPQPLSIMPEGLLDILTNQETADLLAYLAALR